jgi:hypothetical protein
MSENEYGEDIFEEDEEWSEEEDQEPTEYHCSCGIIFDNKDEFEEHQRMHQDEEINKLIMKERVQEVLSEANDSSSAWAKIMESMRESLRKEFAYELNSGNSKTREMAEKQIEDIIQHRLERLALTTPSQGTHATKQMLAKYQERLLVMMSQLMAKKCDICANSPSFNSIEESKEHLKKHHNAKYGEYSRLWKALEPDTSDIVRIELSGSTGKIRLPKSTEHQYGIVEGITEYPFTEEDIARKSIEEEEKYSRILAELCPDIFGVEEERKLPPSASPKAESCSSWEQLSKLYGQLPVTKSEGNSIYFEPISRTKERKKKECM